MAKIVVPRNQQLAMAQAHPKPVYSRVVSLGLTVAPDDVWYIAYTGFLGTDLWLLSVDLWNTPRPVNPNNFTEVRMYVGTSTPRGYDDLSTWEPLLPLRVGMGAEASWLVDDGRLHMRWDMMKFFEGLPRRFGMTARRTTAIGYDVVNLSFQVSEG